MKQILMMMSSMLPINQIQTISISSSSSSSETRPLDDGNNSNSSNTSGRRRPVTRGTRTRTPLQRTIQQSRYYQQCTSIRFIVMILSMIYLLCCLSYCCILVVISDYHYYSLSSLSFRTINMNRSSGYYSNNRQYHISFWDENDTADHQGIELLNNNKNNNNNILASSKPSYYYNHQQLSMSKLYYPWNIFTPPTTTTSSSTSSTNTNTPTTPTTTTNTNSNINTNDPHSNNILHAYPKQQQNHKKGSNSNNGNTEDSHDDMSDDYIDGDDSNNNNDDDNTLQQSSSKQTAHHHITTNNNNNNDYDHNNMNNKNSNPVIYGWTPYQYPNPIIDPTRCAISYILPHLLQLQQEQLEGDDGNNNFNNMNNGSPFVLYNNNNSNNNTKSNTISNNNNNQNQNNNNNNNIHLRLCDPDWVLGGIYLEDVARAMYNFSNTFSIQQQQHEEQVQSTSSSVQEQDTVTNSSTNNDENTENENDENNNNNSNNPDSSSNEDWNVEVGPSNRRRRKLLRTYNSRSASSTSSSSNTDAMLWKNQYLQNNNIDNNYNNKGRIQQYHRNVQTTMNDIPTIELAVATVRKMNLPLVLRQGNSDTPTNTNNNNFYYTPPTASTSSSTSSSYDDDDDDMVNDAAQIFARILHDSWWSPESSSSTANSNNNDTKGFNNNDYYENNNIDPNDYQNNPDYGILLFLSLQDRVCFISTGSSVANILPWWRLDHIVANMKPNLRNRNYGIAILHAIHDISDMLLTGPPTLSDRIHDFIARFGIVIAFATFTFCFGAWGEYRDRRKRWQYAEQRSKLSCVERQKAQQLQMEFRTRCCPICLENYDYGDSQIQTETEPIKDSNGSNQLSTNNRENSTNSLVSMLSEIRKGVVDEMGIPRRGADGRKIKLLRCGHIFCETCWRSWVHSTACGSPCSCPVCRQDVGKSTTYSRRSQSMPGHISSAISNEADSTSVATSTASDQATNSSARSGLLRNGQSYDSFATTGASNNGNPNRPITNGRIVRVNTMLRGAILFRQTSTMANRSHDYVEQSNTNAGQNESTPLLNT